MRRDSLTLPHGRLDFPVFFPDGTYGAVRCVDSDDLRRCAVPGLVMNSYHLLSKPGVQTIKALGGLHAMAHWDRPIITDSGGFQVFSLIRENPKYGEIRKNELIFRREQDGKRTVLTPEKSIQAQFAYGADIMMCLDYCTHVEDSEEVNRLSVETTVRWAKRCKEEYLKQLRERKIPDEKRPLLFAIIQGGGDHALRRQCAEQLIAMDFDGYGFGGWPLDSEGHLLHEILDYTAGLMPDHLPKYAMGIGRPEGIAACHAMGYDIFDCVIPTREARHHRLYCWKEGAAVDAAGGFYQYLYILDDEYIRDSRPISEHCNCPTCQQYSRGYLRHLFKIGDSLAYRLATLHNLRFYTMLMEALRGERNAE